MKTCRICGFINKPEAMKCALCQSDFDPTTVRRSGRMANYNQKTPMKRITKIVIMFIITCVILLPLLILADSFGWFIENPFPVIVCAFAIIFALLFVGHSYWEKRNRGYTYFENDEESPFYAVGNTSLDEEESDELKNQESKNNSSVTFREHVAALTKQSPDATISFDAQMTVMEATNKMAQSSKLPASQLRSVLAAMASRRLIVICGESEELSASTVQSASALTGTETFEVAVDGACENTASLLATENSAKDPLPSQFLSALCVCGEDPAIYCVDLKAEAPNKLETAFADLTPYIEHVFTEATVKVKGVNQKFANITKDEIITLPANRRIFIRISSDRKIPIGAELLKFAAWIEAKDILSDNAAESTSDEIAALSFEHLLQLTEESEKVCYLSEETWKRIDELCDYLAQTVEFCMDNKLAVAMERFTGIYIASGGTEQEATDAVIAALILPRALAILSSKQDCDHGPLLRFMDERFGLENLPTCADFLKKYGTI